MNVDRVKRSIKPSDRVTIYRDAQNREVAVETCQGCDGNGCDGCKRLGFLRVPSEQPHQGDL